MITCDIVACDCVGVFVVGVMWSRAVRCGPGRAAAAVRRHWLCGGSGGARWFWRSHPQLIGTLEQWNPCGLHSPSSPLAGWGPDYRFDFSVWASMSMLGQEAQTTAHGINKFWSRTGLATTGKLRCPWPSIWGSSTDAVAILFQDVNLRGPRGQCHTAARMQHAFKCIYVDCPNCSAEILVGVGFSVIERAKEGL
jgi:hypothetical protein